MKRDTKAETRAINAILWKDWDPIGCGAPEDEYEGYVWPVYELLIDGQSRDAVAEHLRRVARTQIEMQVPEARLAAVVDKLIARRLATEGKYT
jgi:hypothetical protein